MQTIKTVVVVAVLCGIGYGVYVVLNPPPVKEPAELADADPNLWSQPPEVDLGIPAPMGGGMPVAGHDHAPGEAHDHSSDHAAEHAAPPSFPAPLSASPAAGAAPQVAASESVYGGGAPSAYAAASARPGSSDTSSPAVATSAYSSSVGESGGRPAYASTGAPPASDYLSGRSGGGSGVLGETAPLTDGFDTAWRSAQQQLADGNLDLALFTLSQLYGKPERTPEQNARLVPLLDQLAGTVVYSREHHLEPKYVVSAGETLEQIARQYQVSPEFLARVNGIAAPYTLRAGEELKVVRGPFRAEIDTNGGEMTVFLQRYYAGRFPVAVGSQAMGQQGSFRVSRKAPLDPTTGQPVSPTQSANPGFSYWMGLGDSLGLHSGAMMGFNTHGREMLQLSEQDAADVILILADGSEVTVR